MTVTDDPKASSDPGDASDARSGRFRFLGVLVTVIALLTGLYMAYWMFAAHQVRAGIEAWIKDQATRGLTVTYESLEIDGFPLRLNVTAEGAAFLWQAKPASPLRARAPVEWKPPAIRAWMQPWKLARIHLDLSGGHDVTGARRVRLDAASLITVIDLGVRGAWQARLAAAGLDLTVSKAGKSRTETLAVDVAWDGRASIPFRWDAGVDGMTLPPAWASPLGPEVATARIVGKVTGALGDHRDPEMIRRWRNAGGTVEVETLALRHGALNLRANGTMALDSALQPEGAFTAQAEGYGETVDALVRTGLLKSGKATAIKLVLTVMAKREAGRPPYLEAPLSIQNGKLSFGTLDLMQLPPLDWAKIIPSR